ncbi:hypothetical protein INT43_007595 [Umbelopsis isabellina]|uniref:Uncharacterized protein n=1 Tax=Mortierella isabellina TaxID=91625 RepID=A0A8H7PPJ9_MORIS|nr:hypothetical protein INT43_007595 [Umbelopsis isabellina]
MLRFTLERSLSIFDPMFRVEGHIVIKTADSDSKRYGFGPSGYADNVADSGWIGELVKLGGSAVTSMIPKIRKCALGVLAITQHSNNWPKGLQVRDYEMVSEAIAVVCDKNACSGLLESADLDSTGLTSWQERELKEMIEDKKIALRINADAQLWPMKVDTTNGFTGELQMPLSKTKLMQRYGCRFKMGIHICLKGCKYQGGLLRIALDIIVAIGHRANSCLGFPSEVPLCIASLLGNQLVVGHWAANMDIGNWETWFTIQEVEYAEILRNKPKEAIKWIHRNQLLGTANVTYIQTQLQWDGAFYHATVQELEELHKTIASNHDVAPKEVKSLLGCIRENKTSGKQIVAVDGNASSHALLYHLARSTGTRNEEISLSCTKGLMDNDKYLTYTDNPNLNTEDDKVSATLHQ